MGFICNINIAGKISSELDVQRSHDMPAGRVSLALIRLVAGRVDTAY